jgi:hypothetical protein
MIRFLVTIANSSVWAMRKAVVFLKPMELWDEDETLEEACSLYRL